MLQLVPHLICPNSGESVKRTPDGLHLMNTSPLCSTACCQWWVQLMILKVRLGCTHHWKHVTQGKAWVHISRNEVAAGRVLMVLLILSSHSPVWFLAAWCGSQHRHVPLAGLPWAGVAAAPMRQGVGHRGTHLLYLQGFKPAQA